MFVVPYIVCAFICYLLGSIPSGFLAGKLRGIDIRKEGSGNIGATNVVRVLGKPVGITVCILDMLKGWLGVVVVGGVVGRMMAGGDPDVSMQALKIVAGVATILGHNFTCWLRFKGGKGVATTGGVVIAWFPLSFLVVTVVWFLFFFTTRYVSVASIASATALPFAAWRLNGQPLMIAMAVAVSALVVFRHRANIGRLMAGTENRFERKNKA